MSDALRDELGELVRQLGAHISWQRELGAPGLVPSGGSARAIAAVRQAAIAPAPLRPQAVSDPIAATSAEPAAEPSAGVRFEMPGFLRKRPFSVDPAPVPPSPPSPSSVATEPERAEDSVRARRVAVVAPDAEFVGPAASEPAAAADPPPVVRPLFGEDPPRAPETATPALEGEARVGALRVLQEGVAGCTRCRLHADRHHTVFARGNPFARLAFVGEGPGRDEDLTGKPFVGAAGKLLDKIIGAMGLSEDDVYICNVVKCRPPGNRVPEPDEMAMCGGYLIAQLGMVRPAVVVALGKTSASYLLQSTSSMSKLRGRWHQWQGVPLLATWHPAYLLRQPEAKRETWDDMKLVLQKLGLPVPARA